jgi:hypothetical protein
VANKTLERAYKIVPSIQSIIGKPKIFGQNKFHSQEMGNPKAKAVIIITAIDTKNILIISNILFILNPLIKAMNCAV